MRISEIISGLLLLRQYAESHVGNDDDFNDVFYHDIKVIDAAIAELRKKECRKSQNTGNQAVCHMCGGKEFCKEKNYTYCLKCGAIYEKEKDE